jgi:hypothetical protein
VKLLCAMALAVFSVAAPVTSPAQSLDPSLLSAMCSDDYYEDTAGQCGAVSADDLTIDMILTKYGVVITGDTDEEVIVLYYLDDPEDTPVGSIQPRNEDAVSTEEKSNAEPAKEQETIASRVIVLEAPSAIGGEATDDIEKTGLTTRSIPAAAAEPVEDTRTIE